MITFVNNPPCSAIFELFSDYFQLLTDKICGFRLFRIYYVK